MTSVSIVAVCSKDYSRYVEDWLRCIEAILRPPDVAVIEYYREGTSLPQALNRVVRHTDTEWVARLDIDDRALREYLDGIDDCTGDIYMTGFVREDSTGYHVYQPDESGIADTWRPDLEGMHRNQIPAASPFRREMFDTVDGYPDIGFEDWGLWRRMLAAGAKVDIKDGPGFLYERTATGRSQQEFSDARVNYVEELMATCP